MYMIGHFHVLLGLFFVNINIFLYQINNLHTLSVFFMKARIYYSTLCRRNSHHWCRKQRVSFSIFVFMD